MNNESIEKQFDLVADEYDLSRRKFIPCFDDYYEKTTAFAASFLNDPRRIADLGAGTGLLTMYYFRHFPQAEYILTDIARAMLAVAEKRFAGVGNVSCQVLDYAQKLPDGELDLVISALSVHHLENSAKAELFGRIKDKLPVGGWFINYDQFCCDSAVMEKLVTQYWIDHLYHSGLTDEELARWQERRKLDRECSVNDEIAMLKKAGFSTAELIYSSGKFAVIAARV